MTDKISNKEKERADKKREYLREFIDCECGEKVRRYNMSNHLHTKFGRHEIWKMVSEKTKELKEENEKLKQSIEKYKKVIVNLGKKIEK